MVKFIVITLICFLACFGVAAMVLYALNHNQCLCEGCKLHQTTQCPKMEKA